jgi:hypothetical protein
LNRGLRAAHPYRRGFFEGAFRRKCADDRSRPNAHVTRTHTRLRTRPDGTGPDCTLVGTFLEAPSWSDFDKSYIDAQVKEHKAVVDLIDNQLAPNAKSSEVKALLQSLRPKIEGHLKQAQAIQKAL